MCECVCAWAGWLSGITFILETTNKKLSKIVKIIGAPFGKRLKFHAN